MTTISLRLPAALAARLEDLAKEHQKPKSALVREFIERGLASDPDQTLSFHELAKSKCGSGRSGVRDLATHKRHLEDYGG